MAEEKKKKEIPVINFFKEESKREFQMHLL